MTAIRDRRSDPDADHGPIRWDERPIVGNSRGMPWWGALLLAFGLAIVSAIVDLQVEDSLGVPFQICYFIGCVAAVAGVRRASLFAPMVQPPLILAVTVPTVVLFGSGVPAGSDTLAKVLAVGTPLINGFPTMAATTGLTLAIGLVRLYRERDPNRPVKPGKTSNRQPSRPGSRASTRSGAGRSSPVATTGSPRRDGPTSRQAAGKDSRKSSPPQDKPAGDRERPRGTGMRNAPPRGSPAAGRPGRTSGPAQDAPPGHEANPRKDAGSANSGARKSPPGHNTRAQAGRPDQYDRRPADRTGRPSGQDRPPRRNVPPRGNDAPGNAPDRPAPPRGDRQPPRRERPWERPEG